MEEIQHSLLNDEQILWSHNEETTIISGEEFSLWFSLIVGCLWTIIIIGISASKTNRAANLGYTYIDSRPSERSNPEFDDPRSLLRNIFF